MGNNKKLYLDIFKATSIFGGAQIIQILISLIKAKFIALFLGTIGMGITTLFNSTITMITTFSSLGINNSAIRDISEKYASGDTNNYSRVIKVFQGWLFICAGIGTIFTILCSPLLSKFAFGNFSYTSSFIILSIMVIFTLLSQGNITILQGSRKIKDTAISTVLSSIISLAISLPFFYYFKINGIIPALIIATICQYLIGYYFTKKIKKENINISKKEILCEGIDMVKLGIVLVISMVLGNFSTYIINIFISNSGNINDVGLYQAGISMTSQALSLVFASMASDYYPRLIAVCNDSVKVREIVSQQTEIVLLISLPILIGLIVYAPLAIYILLSTEFYPITQFIRWIALAMLFQSAVFPIGYIAFAKGDKKTYFWLEGIWGNVLQITLKLGGYALGGLTGLAIAFFINAVLNLIIGLIVTYRLYTFKLTMSSSLILIQSISLLIISFILTFIKNDHNIYIYGTVIFIISLLYSLKQLDKRINITEIIKSKINK